MGSNKRSPRLFYYVFDLPICSGIDLREVPLILGKELLSQMLAAAKEPAVRFSQHTVGRGEIALRNACAMGLEGLISKTAESAYVSERTDSWRKNKCYLHQEFVVAGYTDPKGSRAGFGALLLGYYEGERLIYAGRVGTGFSDRDLKRISNQLAELERSDTAFDAPPEGAQLVGVHWIEPAIVAEIQFAGWTDHRLVRQASFQGLRRDKDPKEVSRELPEFDPQLVGAIEKVISEMTENETEKTDGGAAASFAGVTLSSPDRVLYHEQGVTKSELARYYVGVADRMLPHVVDRPLSLLRCPRGHEKKCFFQKNYTDSIVGPIDKVDLKEESGEQATYMAISDLAGLIQLVQLGTLEFHPWGCRVDRLERPDMLIFDLDPGPDVDWERVRQAAKRVRGLLEEFGLQAFIKTSGGKGLHVIAPLERRAGWDRVRDFAESIAKRMARQEPDEFTASASKKKREGKIFVDYLRNGRGATNVAPYSTRARDGAPISTPIAWDELDRIQAANAFTVENIEDRWEGIKSDPWEGFFSLRQSVTKAMMESLGGGP
ncbi:MAG: DNA ligase D [Anaerolineales bacterium]